MRTRRIKETAGVAHYHCMSRIVGGARLLGTGEKEMLRELIWRVADFSGVQILTYALMSNHFHLLVSIRPVIPLSDDELIRRYRALYGHQSQPTPLQPTPEVLQAILAEGGDCAENWRNRLLRRMGDVSAFMKTVKQRFSIWYNHTHERYGTLWADRFRSVLIEASPRALATVAAYIDLNPVRAGLALDPAAYRWCGYAEAMAGRREARQGLTRLGVSPERSWSAVAASYRRMIFSKGLTSSKQKGTIDRNRVLEVINNGGKVTRAEALRCRVRYFTDGAVVGSQAYIQGLIARMYGQAGFSARASAHMMEGADWGGLRVLRGLRQSIFE